MTRTMTIADCGLRIANCASQHSTHSDARDRSFNPKSEIRNPKSSRRRAAAFSLVEVLVSLAIAGLLLAAVTAALNASFYAYASAAESASTQSSSRMVMQRLLSMIRSGSLHDAYDPNDAAVALLDPAVGPVRSVGVQMFDYQGNLIRVWWRKDAGAADPDMGTLYYTQGSSDPAPMLEGVRAQMNSGNPYVFILYSRNSTGGLLLARATADLTVEPGADATLALEDAQGAAPAVRLVASTVPRKNLD